MSRPAPPDERFPEYPASWYLLCASADLSGRPLAKTVFGRPVVAFRTAGGRAVVLDGRCSHLGATLAGGRVVGDAIRCPYHNWEYGPDGRCTRVPGSCREPPPFARQAAFPVHERFGHVFVFNGPEPLFPLPSFPDIRDEDLATAAPFRFTADCTWYLFASHAFDVQHFAATHDRRLLGPMQVDCPAPFARRSRYTARVEGDSVYDRLLRWFVGREVTITITTWGGTLFFLTGTFRRALSRFLIAAQPLAGGRTLAEGVVFAPRGHNPVTRALFDRPNLWVRRLFTRGYLRDEAGRLGSPHYNPGTLTDADREMVDFFHWLAALPRTLPGPAAAEWGGPGGNGVRSTARSL